MVDYYFLFFLSIEFHSTFSVYKILQYIFFFIVFRLGSDKLSPVSSTVFPKGSVTRCDFSLEGGWMIFHFRVFESILFFVN